MKKIISFTILFLYFNTNAQSIKFKDNNLKKALIELGFDKNKNSQIEHNEIADVQTLNISEKQIKSIEDLIHFKSLKKLNANGNLITDISIFFGNTVLEEIYLGDNKLGPELIIKDIPNLKGLYAFRNEIKDIKFLSKLSNLKSLYIQDNPIVYLNIENLLNLESLQLFECYDLKQIDLNKNTNIKQFFIIDMKVESIVSKDQNSNSVFLQNIEDAKNPSQIENLKVAPTIKVKKE